MKPGDYVLTPGNELHEVLAVGERACGWDDCPYGEDAVWIEPVPHGERSCVHRELLYPATSREPTPWESEAWHAGWRHEGTLVIETPEGLAVYDQ